MPGSYETVWIKKPLFIPKVLCACKMLFSGTAWAPWEADSEVCAVFTMLPRCDLGISTYGREQEDGVGSKME